MALRSIAVLLSMLSAMGIAFIFYYFTTLDVPGKRFYHFLIKRLAISNLLIALSGPYPGLSSTPESHIMNILAFIKSYGILGSMFWTGLLTYAVVYSLKKQSTNDQLFKLKCTYMIIGDMLPAIFAVLPIFLGHYGRNFQVLFWLNIIPGNSTSLALLLINLVIPWAIVIFFSIYAYILTSKYLNKYAINNKRREILSFFLFPGITFFCYTGVIYACFAAYAGKEDNEWIDAWAVIPIQIQGFLNSLSFCASKIIRGHFKERVAPPPKVIRPSASSSITESFLDPEEQDHPKSPIKSHLFI